MTSDVNHADVAFAVNSWMEFTYPEMTVTVSNPWVQIWKGGIRPLYDTRNDRHVSRAWRRSSQRSPVIPGSVPIPIRVQNRVDIYVQRMLDASQHVLRLQR